MCLTSLNTDPFWSLNYKIDDPKLWHQFSDLALINAYDYMSKPWVWIDEIIKYICVCSAHTGNLCNFKIALHKVGITKFRANFQIGIWFRICFWTSAVHVRLAYLQIIVMISTIGGKREFFNKFCKECNGSFEKTRLDVSTQKEKMYIQPNQTLNKSNTCTRIIPWNKRNLCIKDVIYPKIEGHNSYILVWGSV